MNTVASEVAALGVTKILTRRQRHLREAAVLLALIGAAVSVAMGAAVLGLLSGPDPAWPSLVLRSPITGPLFGPNPGHLQVPVTVALPDVAWWLAALLGLPVFIAWMRFLVGPLIRVGGNVRHRGLATAARVRRSYGARAVRRSGGFTLPGSTWSDRFVLGTSALGMHIGRATTPKKGGELWVNLEQRVRIIARPGWGKTRRLLIPIIRSLQGPVLISSTEPEIFTATVLARATRRIPSRSRLLLYRPAARDYPVAVVDCSHPEHPIAVGYSSIRWNPIPGCEDFQVATRRAQALVKGVDPDGDDGNSTARWFEDGAAKILAAWLYAAALSPDIELVDLGQWLSTSTYTEPESILDDHATDPSALMGMRRYLDPKGGRTTSNVETTVARALYSLTSDAGAEICGSRAGQQFDMAALIRAQGTLYLLAEPARMGIVRPLLSLIASEMFQTAEDIARRSNGTSPVFIGVLDELRSGVRVATLPDIASEKRKFRIGYVYAVTNGSDEAAIYGQADAARLQAAAGTSIYGGLDPTSAPDITDRAGQTPVVTATHGGYGTRSETPQLQDALSTSDMQQLADGESVIVGRDLLPFLAFTPATHEQRGLRRTIARESAQLAQVSA